MAKHRCKATLLFFFVSLIQRWYQVESFHSFSPIPSYKIRANISNPRIFQTATPVHAAAPFGTKIFSTNSNDNNNENEQEGEEEGIDITSNPKLYKVRLPRAPGIEWGTDLSFSFVYVRDLEPAGPASLSGLISKGDQICQLQPVLLEDDNESDLSSAPINLVGASFDAVMNSFATLDKSIKIVDLVFFKGTKEELKAAASGSSSSSSTTGADSDLITITVIENKGTASENETKFYAKQGCNVRNELIARGINVYQSITRFTNCKGKQLCGTCIVNMAEGSQFTNRKSMDEASTLRENPESYRLACVTFAYGDVTVETYPPVNKAQWTR